MSFLKVPEHHSLLPLWCRMLARAINGLLDGKSNNTGTFTLTANSATTTLTFSAGRIGTDTVLLIFPTSANAAAESPYESARDVAAGTLTLTHANTATTDRTFRYALVG